MVTKLTKYVKYKYSWMRTIKKINNTNLINNHSLDFLKILFENLIICVNKSVETLKIIRVNNQVDRATTLNKLSGHFLDKSISQHIELYHTSFKHYNIFCNSSSAVISLILVENLADSSSMINDMNVPSSSLYQTLIKAFSVIAHYTTPLVVLETFDTSTTRRNHFLSSPPPRIIEIIIAPTRFEKNDVGNRFSPYSVNTGYTHISRNDSYICLFRKEEMDKVMIHELIHFLRVDFDMKNYTNHPIFKSITNSISIVSVPPIKDTFCECITDTIAIILTTLLNCILTTSYTASIMRYSLLSEIYYQRELTQVLLDKHRMWLQTTSAFTYYVIKSIIFDNIDSFLKIFHMNCFNAHVRPPSSLMLTQPQRWTKESITKLLDTILIYYMDFVTHYSLKQQPTKYLYVEYPSLKMTWNTII